MKITMEESAARKLIDRLSDEQPGTDLDRLRKRVQDQLAPKAGQPLSADELDDVIDTCEEDVSRLEQAGNLNGADREVLARLKSATAKLTLMWERQSRREAAEP